MLLHVTWRPLLSTFLPIRSSVTHPVIRNVWRDFSDRIVRYTPKWQGLEQDAAAWSGLPHASAMVVGTERVCWSGDSRSAYVYRVLLWRVEFGRGSWE
jgi:hypothetical protein